MTHLRELLYLYLLLLLATTLLLYTLALVGLFHISRLSKPGPYHRSNDARPAPQPIDSQGVSWPEFELEKHDKHHARTTANISGRRCRDLRGWLSCSRGPPHLSATAFRPVRPRTHAAASAAGLLSQVLRNASLLVTSVRVLAMPDSPAHMQSRERICAHAHCGHGSFTIPNTRSDRARARSLPMLLPTARTQ